MERIVIQKDNVDFLHVDAFIRGICDECHIDNYYATISVAVTKSVEVALSAKTDADPEYLRDMIRLVNRTQLQPQDVLSDSLYFFDRETGKITIA